MPERELGLFPLGTVLVPGELIPLHIFEERYKDLFAHCLEHAEPFVLLYADDDGAREIGCTARVTDVLERFDDGRLNVVAEGDEVVRVVEVTRGRTYMTGRVAPAEDDPDEGDAREGALELLAEVVRLAGTDVELEEDRPLSYAIAARVEFPTDEKQQLLELRSERRRLVLVSALLRRALAGLEAAAEIRERAQGNGKVSPPGA